MMTPERQAALLAYCKLTELADDPEVEALIPVLYDAAVGYLASADVTLPEAGTARAAQYNLVVNCMVLDAWEHRGAHMSATAVADNPGFRQLIDQLKLTEPALEGAHG